MRIIQYFLIGFFLSLCTIPAFAACPPGMIREGDNCVINGTSYYIPEGTEIYIEFDVNNDVYGTWLKNNTSFDFTIPNGFDEVWYQYASYGSGDTFNVTAYTSDYSSWQYLTPLEDVPGTCTACRSPSAESWYSQYMISGGGGGGGYSPVALFNIDGIKENILVTLLSIVGALLILLVFKYAWSKVKDMLGDSGYDYYERSVPIGNNGLTRDTLYSNDGTVQRITYSNQQAGLDEQDSHKFYTGYSKDWDNIQEPPIKGDNLSESEWEGRILAFKRTGTW